MKRTTITKIAGLFILGLLLAPLGYATSCGSHGKEGHKSDKHGKTTEHSEHKQAPEVGEKALSGFYEVYLKIQKAFAGDDLKTAKRFIKQLEKAAKGIKGEDKHESYLNHLKESIAGISGSTDIKAARDNFFHLSYLTISLLQHNKYKGDKKAFVYHCPMAAGGKGADWLQSSEGTKNPYYGKRMLTCGSKTKTIKK